MAKDPVCGMEVDEAKASAHQSTPGWPAAGSSTYKGKTYYFCASQCEKAFDANPEQYAEKG